MADENLFVRLMRAAEGEPGSAIAVRAPSATDQLRAMLAERLESRGGRPSDPSWTMTRLIPMRPETWSRLNEVAETISARGARGVSAGQLAALVLEHGLHAIISAGESPPARSESDPPPSDPARGRRRGRDNSVPTESDHGSAAPRDHHDAVASPSVKATSGRGFRFETLVGVWFAAAMLAEVEPLRDLGPISRVRFQTRDDGWLLDDLLVTFADGRRLAASIKSNQQFRLRKTTGSYVAPVAIVKDAWRELTGRGSPSFDPGRDLLALIAPPPPSALATDLAELQQLASHADPGDLTRRVRRSSRKDPALRNLFESFAPTERAEGGLSPAELLVRFRFLALDFFSTAPSAWTQMFAWCRDALEPDAADRTAELVNTLYLHVDEVRTTGGSVTTAQLLFRLAKHFPLRRRAASEAKARLDGVTARNLALLPTTLAGQLRLERTEAAERLRESVGSKQFVAVTGRSGGGKSALLATTLTGRDDVDFVWIAAADLESPSTATSIERDIERIVGEAVAPLSVVALDGLDRAFDEALFKSAARIIRLVSESDGWRFALPCAADAWQRVAEQLSAHNARYDWTVLPVNPLGEAEIAQVVSALPALARFFAEPLLASVLRNLKQLDLVVQLLIGQTEPPTEVRIASLFWNGLVQRGPRGHERAQFLERLAERQAERLEAATPRAEFDDVSVLGELESDGLCTVRSGRISFTHDLYGDWTREQVIEAHQNHLADYLGARLDSPLWHRALRLRASALLDIGDLAAWRHERQTIAAGNELIDDLFVEAALHTADPRAVMDSLWPDLVADDGRLLRRLLGRLLHVGTTPNPATVAFFRAIDSELETYAAATTRDPIWPLWLPALQVLAVRAEELVRLAPGASGRVAELWLRRTPPDWPLRMEAARISVAVGERMYATKRDHGAIARDDIGQDAYKALLAAARELPDEVANLALQLAGRRNVAQERSQRRREKVAPWPEGPQRDVDDAFRKVCLETDALQPLMLVRPQTVEELLLALLVEEPRESDATTWPSVLLPGEEMGLHSFIGWASPSWFRGPFAAFLRAAPRAALRFTLRLVNFATDRYCDRYGDGRAPFVDMQLEEGSARWRGDARVYGWFRSAAPAPPTLTSVLMALEHWLYERLDADELGNELETILRESRSVAFGGLLTAVGCRDLRLLAERLQPLLGVPEFFDWDHQRLVQLEPAIGVAWQLVPTDPQLLVEQAKAWNNLPHRRLELERCALWLLLNHEAAMGDFFANRRQRWLERIAGLDQHDPESVAIARLAARFDRSNYREVVDVEQPYWEFVEPHELREMTEPARQEAQASLTLVQLPIQCRAILDGTLQLPAGQLDEFVALVREQATAALPDKFGLLEGEELRASALCGGAAVLVLRHRDWLRGRTEENWCRQTLLGVVFDPPEDEHGHYFPGTDYDWHVFCAEAISALWSERTHDVELRRAIALLAIHPDQVTVARLGRAAFARRGQLGADFRRLQRFMVEWADFRGQVADQGLAERAASWQEPEGESAEQRSARFGEVRERLRRREDELITSFVAGTLEDRLPAWSDEAVAAEPSMAGAVRGRRRQRHSRIDIEYLSHAFEWLPALGEATDTDERREWIRFWREAARYLAQRLGADVGTDEEVDGTPYQSDYWLLTAAGAVAAEMARDEDPSQIWVPFVQLGGAAHYWIESFLRAFFGRGLSAPRPQSFAATWRSMIDYARAAERWRLDERGRGGYRVLDNWLLLLGLDVYVKRAWTGANVDLVREMVDEYEALLPDLVIDDRAAIALTDFLRTPAAAPLRASGLTWLAETADRTQLWHGDQRLIDPLADLLDDLVRQNEPSIRGGASGPFRKLLQLLAAKQTPLALELLARLGRAS